MNASGTINAPFYVPLIVDGDFTGAEIEGVAVIAYEYDRGETSWRIDRLTTEVSKSNPDDNGPMLIYRTAVIDPQYHRDTYYRILSHLERKEAKDAIDEAIAEDLENSGIVLPDPYDEHRTYSA